MLEIVNNAVEAGIRALIFCAMPGDGLGIRVKRFLEHNEINAVFLSFDDAAATKRERYFLNLVN